MSDIIAEPKAALQHRKDAEGASSFKHRRIFMTGYLIADIDVHDSEAYGEYRKIVGATIEKYGGKFLVRAGAHEVIEGD